MRGLKSYCCGVAESDAPVAPYAGAWIEINGHMKDAGGIAVAPYAGAWIEINHLLGSFLGDGVAPYAGAWIEIVLVPATVGAENSRTLRGCVD